MPFWYMVKRAKNFFLKDILRASELVKTTIVPLLTVLKKNTKNLILPPRTNIFILTSLKTQTFSKTLYASVLNESKAFEYELLDK